MTFLSDFQELKTYNFPPGSLKDLAFIGIKLKMLCISLLLMPSPPERLEYVSKPECGWGAPGRRELCRGVAQQQEEGVGFCH